MTTERKTINAIIDSLINNPEKWKHGDYTSETVNGGVVIWVSNIPILFTRIEKPSGIILTISNKIRLYNAVKESRLKSILPLI